MKASVNILGKNAAEIGRLYDECFENSFAYRGSDLGFSYTPESCGWKLWAPTATRVALRLYTCGSDEEIGAVFLGQHEMELTECGVWAITLGGDYRDVYYSFLISHGEGFSEITDPYAKAAGVDGVRAMVIADGETDPEGWELDDYAFTKDMDNAAVWEVHVRDFSESPDSGMIHKGKFLAFTEENTYVPERPDIPTGLSYLKNLGITHVQLLPIFDFATADERHPENSYNWGYDPKNYNIPEGAYSTDPYHGEVRNRELKLMVQALHRAGIGVIMDVVYNHTFLSEGSCLHQAVPYYYHRLTADGHFANGSGCGNEIATERYMVRKYIVDSVCYWAEEYHIDGFRFDLMGLMDTETLNEIRDTLSSRFAGKNILMYGEPWGAGYPAIRNGYTPADKGSVWSWRDGIGLFNDEGRDALKGNNFEESDEGFLAGGGRTEGVVRMLSGEPWSGRMVQYTSCHDNFTLWDKITASAQTDGSGYNAPELRRLALNKLSATAVMMSNGMPFMMAGEEFGRTKYADANSYQSPIAVNGIFWKRTKKFGELVDYYKGLLAFRKSYFNLAEDVSTELLCAEEKLLVFCHKKPAFDILVALNPSDEPRELSVPLAVWTLFADEVSAGVEPKWIRATDTLCVAARGVLLAVRYH